MFQSQKTNINLIIIYIKDIIRLNKLVINIEKPKKVISKNN